MFRWRNCTLFSEQDTKIGLILTALSVNISIIVLAIAGVFGEKGGLSLSLSLVYQKVKRSLEK